MQKLPKEERRAVRATNKSSSCLEDTNSLPVGNLQVSIKIKMLFLQNYLL